MPKKSQRKKKIKNEDFKKVKLKVGGKKLKPENVTDTSFKSRSIVVPGQSINSDKSLELTNKRNLTLKDLLSQLKHYSASVRKDALVGLKDLIVTYPHLLRLHTHQILTSLLKIIIDEDPATRSTLLSALPSILPYLTENQIIPFKNLIWIYTNTGMTHIYEDVRIHALKFWNLWIETWGSVVAGAEGSEKILDNYISLLGNDNASTSQVSAGSLGSIGKGNVMVNPNSQLGTSKTRTEVLNSLENYLNATLTYGDPTDNGNDRAKSENSVTISTVNILDHISSPAPLSIFTESSSSSTKSHSVNHLLSFTKTISPILTSFFLETAPSAFNATVSLNPSLSLIHSILKINSLLWSAISNDVAELSRTKEDTVWFENTLKGVIKHMLVYFPFGSTTGFIQDSKAENLVKEMNVVFCQMIANLLKVHNHMTKTLQHVSSSKSSPRSDETEDSSLPTWVTPIYDFISDIFTPSSVSGSKTQLMADISPYHLNFLFPAVKTILSQSPLNRAASLLDAIITYTMSLTSSSLAKKSLTGFLCDLLNPLRSDSGLFLVVSHSHLSTSFPAFISSLPKYLWELQSHSLDVSQKIILFLQSLLRSSRNTTYAPTNPDQSATPLAEILISDKFQSTFVPIFYVYIKSKGPMYGPFIHYPISLQKEVISLLYYFGTGNVSDQLVKGLVSCCLAPNVSTTPTIQIISTLHTILSPSQLLSFIFTLVVGYTREEDQLLSTTVCKSEIIGIDEFLNWRNSLLTRNQSNKRKNLGETPSSSPSISTDSYIKSQTDLFRTIAVIISRISDFPSPHQLVELLSVALMSSGKENTLRASISVVNVMAFVVELAKNDVIALSDPEHEDIDRSTVESNAIITETKEFFKALSTQFIKLIVSEFTESIDTFTIVSQSICKPSSSSGSNQHPSKTPSQIQSFTLTIISEIFNSLPIHSSSLTRLLQNTLLDAILVYTCTLFDSFSTNSETSFSVPSSIQIRKFTDTLLVVTNLLYHLAIVSTKSYKTSKRDNVKSTSLQVLTGIANRVGDILDKIEDWGRGSIGGMTKDDGMDVDSHSDGNTRNMQPRLGQLGNEFVLDFEKVLEKVGEVKEIINLV
ncbi:hypothetical protein BKA69DRAFT_1128606 [Paraphysoderma sedebokerense]|nr:hypothetical protein BKA69DRAFT_1128606 [Paraphysoderma sedebokerense]